MRRLLAVGALLGVGVLVVRPRLSKVHERLMAHCEGMFERMPDTFPPKKMMLGVEQLRADTARILERLEAGSVDDGKAPGSSAAGAMHDAA
jgi:hypothetical protein